MCVFLFCLIVQKLSCPLKSSDNSKPFATFFCTVWFLDALRPLSMDERVPLHLNPIKGKETRKVTSLCSSTQRVLPRLYALWPTTATTTLLLTNLTRSTRRSYSAVAAHQFLNLFAKLLPLSLINIFTVINPMPWASCIDSIAVSLFVMNWLSWQIVSVSDDKIQIKIQILRRGALSTLARWWLWTSPWSKSSLLYMIIS